MNFSRGIRDARCKYSSADECTKTYLWQRILLLAELVASFSFSWSLMPDACEPGACVAGACLAGAWSLMTGACVAGAWSLMPDACVPGAWCLEPIQLVPGAFSDV